MIMTIKLEISHKEIILTKIKGLFKIRNKIIIIMNHNLKNPMIIIDNTGKIAIHKEIRDLKNTDIYKFQCRIIYTSCLFLTSINCVLIRKIFVF